MPSTGNGGGYRSREMSLGKKILTLRLQSERTQREVAEEAGISVSYLSRLENNRAAPSLQTLRRIANALGLDVSRLFESEPAIEASDRCPVSLSGKCVLDQLYAGRGRRPEADGESYSAEQLELLKLCNFLLHLDDPEIISTLSTVV
ncbi:MAG: helix-turn-helix transcriptional regulator [Acidobacteriota bacterium]|nr:MAG: helix-turn-helix transcriptional regulator [Acidobacteriota bacterium]